jgi:flagellar biosynthesis protein
MREKDEDNKRKNAVALKYEPSEQDAPKLIAKGSGKIAENIIKRAHEYQVPIQEDPSLVSILSELDLNQNIPEELYKAVAEVFAFIYKADQLTDVKKNHK